VLRLVFKGCFCKIKFRLAVKTLYGAVGAALKQVDRSQRAKEPTCYSHQVIGGILCAGKEEALFYEGSVLLWYSTGIKKRF
jgi:hypothetical protein